MQDLQDQSALQVHKMHETQIYEQRLWKWEVGVCFLSFFVGHAQTSLRLWRRKHVGQKNNAQKDKETPAH